MPYSPKQLQKESATSPVAVPLHGPGGLLNTPGLGGRAKKWGKRRKESRYSFSFKATGAPGEKIAPGITRIRGNLCNVHGKYGPCDKADLRPTAPGQGPKKDKPDKRDANRQSTDQQLGLQEDASAALNALADGQVVTDDGGLVKLGLAEPNPDGSFRLTAAGKKLNTARNAGNLGNARGAMGEGQSASAKRQEQADKKRTRDEEAQRKRTDAEAKRQNAARDRERRRVQTEQRREQVRADAERRRQEQDAQRQAQRNQPRPAPAPRQQAPKQPLADRVAQRAREQAEQKARNRASVRSQMAESDSGLSPSGFDAFTAFADGGQLSPQMAQGLTEMGLVEGDPPRMTKAGEQVAKDIDAGNFRAAADGVGKATDDLKTSRQTASDRAKKQQEAAARRAMMDQRRADADARRIAREAARATKSFTVFKEASGRLRWITRTTTAFKDRDGEILSIAALDKAVARMKATGLYGPLRWWHAGKMTPNDPERPWGPGIDLGMCDASMRIGRTLVESGTFFDDRVGLALAQKAHEYETSPGFVYEEPWRQPDGTFIDMVILERSPVPVRYARASNLFTGFAVKEHLMADQMTDAEIARRWEIFRKETGVDAATIGRVDQARITAEKSADTQRIAFKEAAAGIPVHELDGKMYALKEGKLFELKAPMPPTEMVEAGTTEADDGLAEEAAVDDTAVAEEDEFIGDMSVNAFKTMIRAIIQELSGPIVELDSKMAAMGYERKTKEEDPAAAKVAQLEVLIKEAQAKIAELSSDATKRPFRPSLDGQEPADIDRIIEERRKALAEQPTTGDPQLDSVISWAESTSPIGTGTHRMNGHQPS